MALIEEERLRRARAYCTADAAYTLKIWEATR
jgi:hypothetical protein